MLRKLSCGSANDDVEHYRSRLIDKELRADRKKYRSTYRLLLLGKRVAVHARCIARRALAELTCDLNSRQ